MSPTFWSTRRRKRKLWSTVGAVLLLGGAGVLFVGIRGSDHPLPPPVPSAAAVRSAAETPPPSALPLLTALTTTRSVPLTLRIPVIGLSIAVSTLGLNADGTVQVPSDTVQVGWFRLGPTPGQLGSAVILGHVDNYTGPGVFFKLRTLAAGDEVDVGLADGITARFVVNAVVMYSKSQFPATRVYASHGSSALQLLTCGGTFDRQTGHYLSNVVVYTSLVAVVPAPTPAGGGVRAQG
jgi:hypothetical protein